MVGTSNLGSWNGHWTFHKWGDLVLITGKGTDMEVKPKSCGLVGTPSYHPSHIGYHMLWSMGKPMEVRQNTTDIYRKHLVNSQFAIEHDHRNRWFMLIYYAIKMVIFHSYVVLVYQRVLLMIGEWWAHQWHQPANSVEASWQQYVQHDQPFVGATRSRLLSGKWYPRCILVGGILYLPLWRLESLEPRRSETFWLVVDLPLWKMMEFVSWDDYSILFPIYGKIKKMFQTTNQCW
jgi:hypothetical protein